MSIEGRIAAQFSIRSSRFAISVIPNLRHLACSPAPVASAAFSDLLVLQNTNSRNSLLDRATGEYK
jgi:hypothetical protein